MQKRTTFQWSKEREHSFLSILQMMSDRTYLALYNPNRKTHLVSDASLVGIAASLYQEDNLGRWLPVEHISRVLS